MPNDFEIINAALTGWDEPEPVEVPPARAALDRIQDSLTAIKRRMDEDHGENAKFHFPYGIVTDLLSAE